ncbi:rRNA N-glycosidase [Rhynchospora pubera]|uniref:rRNA N-glycosidase n=1 Tax=Rhynchospora pubera TaxID=906938 RepID=A0AAV8AJC2_9POAL|nr:rRNA N-glycosidase [Rhynchospora pubera]KAJ4775232.1 rRNA N-glycosidase [Rhynchospora pubera]
MEVFSVKFVNHDKLDFSNIYGVILMEVDVVGHILYNRKLGDPTCIDSEGFVTLRMPCRGIFVIGNIGLYSYLYNLELNPRFDFVGWGPGMHGPMPYKRYGQVISERVDSMFGPIEVTLAVYLSAVVASIDVTLIDFEDKHMPEVYGHVKVKNNKTCDPRAVSWLFRTDNKDTVTCISRSKSGGCIALPLLRNVVVVPFDSTMIVDMCICCGDTVFASGEVMFRPKMTGKKSRFIVGSHGKIGVEVSWSRVEYDDMLGYCW